MWRRWGNFSSILRRYKISTCLFSAVCLLLCQLTQTEKMSIWSLHWSVILHEGFLKHKLNENKIFPKKNEESGQSTAFPFNNVFAQDSLEKSAPKGLVTGLLMFFCCILGLSYLLSRLPFCSSKTSEFQRLNSTLLSKTASLLSHNCCITCKSYINVLLTFPLPLALCCPFYSITCVNWIFIIYLQNLL